MESAGAPVQEPAGRTERARIIAFLVGVISERPVPGQAFSPVNTMNESTFNLKSLGCLLILQFAPKIMRLIEEPPAVNDAVLRTRCCIAGGGPAGMMAGFLLARAGVDVIVLEKHGDFLRDFRGDTIHPSTLNLMHELGFLEEFLALPHQKLFQIEGWVGNMRAPIADFSGLPAPCNFIALMPQWDFLNFLAKKGEALPNFKLMMRTEAKLLIEGTERIIGIAAQGPEGPLKIHADLTIAADGRHSVLPDQAGLKTIDLGAPMDVLWFRLSRQETDESDTIGRFESGRILIRINRGAYWQCGYVVAKNAYDILRARGLDAFKADVAGLAGLPRARLDEITGFDSVKLLSVSVDRLERWRKPGFLAIGDAAHAMSPVGGVGINLAVQDAVAAANILTAPLLEGRLGEADLAAVERRRLFPVRVTQRGQIAIQNMVIARTLGAEKAVKPPWFLRVVAGSSLLRGLLARILGLGVRPEHIETVAARRRQPA
jgi:2-polyprenyl-6-methoxyphenol hydroxylase-like FAD-dependent oxidoreductase